jgi:hypothetical protein
MRVRVVDPVVANELDTFLRGRGFLTVVRTDTELDVSLLNHVSARYDSIAASQALSDWLALHPDVLIRVDE